MQSIDAYVAQVLRGEVPSEAPYIPNWPLSHVDTYAQRDKVKRAGMFALVDKQMALRLSDIIKKATNLSNPRVLEVMAGVGWLARALADTGLDVEAVDDASWSFHDTASQVFPVRCMDALEAVKSCSADCLVVSWPPYSDEHIVAVCKAWGTTRPIVYIGEGEGGCCACDAFFASLDMEVVEVGMAQWDGLHDRVYLGKWGRVVIAPDPAHMQDLGDQ